MIVILPPLDLVATVGVGRLTTTKAFTQALPELLESWGNGSRMSCRLARNELDDYLSSRSARFAC